MKQRSEPAPAAEFNSTAAVNPLASKAAAGDDEKKGNRDEESILPDGTRQVKRRKKRRKKEDNKKLYLFIGAWFFVIIGLVLLFNFQGGNQEEADVEAGIGSGMKPWEREFLREHLNRINRNFNGFHAADTHSKKQQYIDRSSELAADYNRFNQTHSVPTYVAPMRLVTQNILEIQKEPLVLAMETIWTDQKSRQAEAVHVWDGDGWKLDWESYAPYSSVPWTLFRSGVGKKKGEFRLLVRRRKGGADSNEMTLLFYSPQPPGEGALEAIRMTESPEVVIERRGEMGKKLRFLLDEREAGKMPIESILGQGDPEGMVRVWVKLAWEESEGESEPQMVLEELKGVSWYGSRIQGILAVDEVVEEEAKSALNDSDSNSSLETDE